MSTDCHRKRGEKANKKQMACIGCVYTVDPHVRTPEELVATLFRDPDRPPEKPPEACQKRYWTALSREEDGRTVRAQDEVFQHLRADVALRRRAGQTLVHLSDGQHSLETDRRKYLPQDKQTVDVLDLMHVLPRLWEAAHLFHKEGGATPPASSSESGCCACWKERPGGSSAACVRWGSSTASAAFSGNVCDGCASSERTTCTACVTTSTCVPATPSPPESSRGLAGQIDRAAFNALRGQPT